MFLRPRAEIDEHCFHSSALHPSLHTFTAAPSSLLSGGRGSDSLGFYKNREERTGTRTHTHTHIVTEAARVPVFGFLIHSSTGSATSTSPHVKGPDVSVWAQKSGTVDFFMYVCVCVCWASVSLWGRREKPLHPRLNLKPTDSKSCNMFPQSTWRIGGTMILGQKDCVNIQCKQMFLFKKKKKRLEFGRISPGIKLLRGNFHGPGLCLFLWPNEQTANHLIWRIWKS